MADNNVIDNVAEAMENAGMDVSILEPAVEKVSRFDLKSAVCGTVVGAAGAVLVRKAYNAIKSSSDEIKTETNKVKAEKIRKKIDRLCEKLDSMEVETADQPDDSYDEEVVED